MESFRSSFQLCGSTKSRKEDMNSSSSSTPNSSRRKPLQELNAQIISPPSVSSPSLYKYHGCQVIPEETEDQENICPTEKQQQRHQPFTSPGQSDREKTSTSSDGTSKSEESPFAYPHIWESSGSGLQSGESRGSPASNQSSQFSGGLPSTFHSSHCTSTPSKNQLVTPPAVFRTPSEQFSRSSERLRSTRTPKNRVRNPFDNNIENLCCMTVSPSLFQKVRSPSQTEEANFRWSVDQLAVLHPVLFETSPSNIYEFPVDPETERKAQEAIDVFFSQSNVVPSPWSGSVKKVNLLKLAEGATPRTASKSFLGGDSVTTKEVWSQTELTLPPELPPEVEAVLANYYNFTQDQSQQNSTEAEDIANLSSSTLRRKLLFSYDSSPGASPKERSPCMNRRPQESPPFVISDELLAEDAVLCSGSMIRRDSGLSGAESQLSSPDVSPIRLGNENIKPHNSSTVSRRTLSMRDSICDSVVTSKGRCSFNQMISPALSPVNSIGFKSQHSPCHDSAVVQRLSPVPRSNTIESGLMAHRRLSRSAISTNSPHTPSSGHGNWVELVYEARDRSNIPRNDHSQVVMRLSGESCTPGENEICQVRSCPPCPKSESSPGLASKPLSKLLSHSVKDIMMTCEQQTHNEGKPLHKVKEVSANVAEAGSQSSEPSSQESTPHKVCHQSFCVQVVISESQGSSGVGEQDRTSSSSTQFSSSPIQARGQSMVASAGDKFSASPPVSPILGRCALATRSNRSQSQQMSQNYLTSQSPHMSIDLDDDGTIGTEKCDSWVCNEKERPDVEGRQRDIVPTQLPFIETTTNLTSMVDMDTEGQPFFEPSSATGESSTIDMVSQDTGYQTGSLQITSNLMAVSNFASESLQFSKYETGGHMTSHELDLVQCQRMESKFCRKGRNEELGCNSIKTKVVAEPLSYFGQRGLADFSDGSQVKSSNLLSRQGGSNSEDCNLIVPVPIGSSTPTKYT